MTPLVMRLPPEGVEPAHCLTALSSTSTSNGFPMTAQTSYAWTRFMSARDRAAVTTSTLRSTAGSTSGILASISLTSFQGAKPMTAVRDLYATDRAACGFRLLLSF